MTLEKLLKLARIPGELDNVICIFKGRPLTLREAIEILQAGGKEAEELQALLKKLGLDPKIEIPEEWWEIAYERWKRKPKVRIFFQGKLWTKDEILKEMEKRSEIGAYFVLLELGYLRELLK